MKNYHRTKSELKEDSKLPRLAYSMEETAQVLGVCYITVWRLVKRGMLRSCGDTRTHLIPIAEIERFLKDGLPPLREAKPDNVIPSDAELAAQA